MDSDKLIARSMKSTVAAVALFAAAVSYNHIYDLAASHHNGGWAAALLPLSVDGPILAASTVLLYAAKQKIKTPTMARFTLWLGIAATIAANVAFGIPGGLVAAVISAWPALSFIMTVETVMQVAKSKRLSTPKRPVNPEPVEPLSVSIVRNERRKIGQLKEALRGDDQSSYTKAASTAVTPNVQKVPSLRQIQSELGCGQKMAQDLQGIMRARSVDLSAAQAIREEAKRDGVLESVRSVP